MNNHIPVKSSNLKSVAYDSDSGTLEIAFKKGKYTYTNINESTYNGLMNAHSKGGYFARFIKPKGGKISR